MIRRKLVTLSMFGAAAALYAAALVTAPSAANACLWVCDGGSCPGGRLHARNSCTGAASCVTICATPS